MMAVTISLKPPVRTSRPRILLVDDDPAVLAGLRRVVKIAEPTWEIHTAIDGARALQALRSGHFDILLTDLTMPGVDGLELLAEVRRSHPGTIRIIHSSQLTTLGPERVRHLSDAAIPKPSTALDLLSVVRWAERASRPGARP